MNITVPELSLVVMIGASGSGKSSLARRLFKPTEILSSDTCRGWVSDDENSQEATGDAFDALHFIAKKRLARGLLTVIDATNVRAEDRKGLVLLAREFHCLPVAIIMNTPEHVCQARNAARPDRQFGPHVVRAHRMALRRDARGIEREGFRKVFWLNSEEDAAGATLVREPLWNNLKHERGPFDIIGDVHGCYDELVELLGKLGHQVAATANPERERRVAEVSHTSETVGIHTVFDDRERPQPVADAPGSRRLVFLGDLCDRGPNTPAVYRLVMSLVAAGRAICVPGNHDMKLLRALRGKNVQLTHGLDLSLAQLEKESPEFRAQVAEFIDDMVSHYVLDDGRLVVAHAGMKESMQGRGSGAVREFALYGETTGETDEFGLPVRYNWAADYRGRAAVVYGHTPVPEAEWLNHTICIDTGCVFGGALTALRWPEREIVSVKARAVYAESKKPFLREDQRPALTLQQQQDDVIDIGDVAGKRPIETRLAKMVTIRAENAAAALEVMSRFAADPRWLIYLPPTMSPCETSRLPGLLEHPAEAFAHYRMNGVGDVVCEEKHMGSRAVAVVCRDADTARTRFGVDTGERGIVYTRTGRRFFDDAAVEAALLERLAGAIGGAGLWEELASDWVCLDCELMPWSAKAQALIREQYAAVGAAAEAGVREAIAVLERAAVRIGPSRAPSEGGGPTAGVSGQGVDLHGVLESFQERRGLVAKYREAYRKYCWTVSSVDDLRLAPFHVLASEGRTHLDKDHVWHMKTLARLAAGGEKVLVATPFKIVSLASTESEAEATAWWTELTSRGGEGMVVKPRDFIARGPRGVLQPAVKCRGPQYLRIIYGPEYSRPEHLERLRSRGVGAKRSLALREFALGVEALERFVRREPLRRVHECVFGVLALESEPVDPRL